MQYIYHVTLPRGCCHLVQHQQLGPETLCSDLRRLNVINFSDFAIHVLSMFIEV